MRDVYAVTLRPNGPANETLPVARAVVRHWASHDRGGWPSHLPPTQGQWDAPDGAVLTWRTLTSPPSRLWVLTVDEPFRADLTLRWRTVVHVGADDDGTVVHLRKGLVSTSPNLSGTVAFEITAPPVVAALVDRLAVYDAGRQLGSVPMGVQGAGQIRELLLNGGRRLPVAVLIDQPHDAPQIARALAGLAHVVPATIDHAYDDQLAGFSLPVFTGSAALYWPARNRDGSPKRILFRPDELAQTSAGLPAWPLIRTVYATSAFRIPTPPLEAALEAEEVRARIREVEARLRGATPNDELTDLLTAWEKDLRALERTRSELLAARAEAQAARDDLSALLEAFDESVATAASRRVARHAPSEPRSSRTPRSMLEAIEFAAEDTEHLVFLPEAFSSAEASPYGRPGDVYEDLVALDRLVARWRADNLPGGFTPAAAAAGLPWRPDISATARNQFGEDYARTLPDGRRVLLGPHLRYGGDAPPDRHCRVYLWLDRENRQVVVGYAGRHLRDAHNRHR